MLKRFKRYINSVLLVSTRKPINKFPVKISKGIIGYDLNPKDENLYLLSLPSLFVKRLR